MKGSGRLLVLRGLVVLVLVLTMFGCIDKVALPDGAVDMLNKAAGASGCRGCAPDEGEAPGEGEMPGEGEVPGEGEAPGEGEMPAEGEAPGEGEIEGDLVVWLPGNVPFVMMHIPAGTYLRGAYPGEQDAFTTREEPQHQVILTNDFYLGRYSVTKRQWHALMDYTPWSSLYRPSVLDDPDSPAIGVSWNEAQEFIAALNAHITNTDQGIANFRLPTEAEWEYACRAGTTTRYYWGDDPDNALIGDYAWYRANTHDLGNRYAHVVGLKLPNAWGLYDMSGNVHEWCHDWSGAYPDGPVTDPTGPDTGSNRILRGGSYEYSADQCRSAYRDFSSPTFTGATVGFRLARF